MKNSLEKDLELFEKFFAEHRISGMTIIDVQGKICITFHRANEATPENFELLKDKATELGYTLTEDKDSVDMEDHIRMTYYYILEPELFQEKLQEELNLSQRI